MPPDSRVWKWLAESVVHWAFTVHLLETEKPWGWMRGVIRQRHPPKQLALVGLMAG